MALSQTTTLIRIRVVGLMLLRKPEIHDARPESRNTDWVRTFCELDKKHSIQNSFNMFTGIRLFCTYADLIIASWMSSTKSRQIGNKQIHCCGCLSIPIHKFGGSKNFARMVFTDILTSACKDSWLKRLSQEHQLCNIKKQRTYKTNSGRTWSRSNSGASTRRSGDMIRITGTVWLMQKLRNIFGLIATTAHILIFLIFRATVAQKIASALQIKTRKGRTCWNTSDTNKKYGSLGNAFRKGKYYWNN